MATSWNKSLFWQMWRHHQGGTDFCGRGNDAPKSPVSCCSATVGASGADEPQLEADANDPQRYAPEVYISQHNSNSAWLNFELDKRLGKPPFSC